MPDDSDDSPEGWGSHKPALRALARFMPIRSVIEFGAGLHSTGHFLNRKHFPLLESLVSFEHVADWAAQVRTDDPRHRIIVTPTEEFEARSTGMRADFVFLDSAGGRYALMPHCLTLAPIFAIHDCREGELSTMGFKYVRGFNSKIQTVFASNTIDLTGIELE
jgi:hypothetical protein